MKKKTWFFKGIPALMLVFGLLLSACPTDPDPGGQEYTVTFDAQGGSVNPSTVQVTEGGTVAVLPIPSRTGYTFDGWYTQDETQFTTSTPVTGNITVYAHWSGGSSNPFEGTWYGTINTSAATLVFTASGWTFTSQEPLVSGQTGTYSYSPADDNSVTINNASGPFGRAMLSNGALAITIFGPDNSVAGSGTFTKNQSGGQQYTVTFDPQGGEVNPPTVQVAAGGTVTNLPTPTRTGYTFDGWYTQDGTQFTAGTAVNGDITVSAHWSGGGGGGGNLQDGVYIGLISFAGTAKDLTGGTPVFLDAEGQNSLISKLTSDYTSSTQPGTAIFYGVHQAFANLTKWGTYPPKLDSVNVITFTDGLDTQSATLSVYAPIEEKSFTLSEYKAYVQSEIANRKIGGQGITAYSVGVKAGDVNDIQEFEDNLAKIASAGNSTELTVFTDLGDTFKAIADNLQVVHKNTTFTMVLPMEASGTKVRMTFDIPGVPGDDPMPSSLCETSTKYIEGIIEVIGTGQTMSIKYKDITYAGGLGSSLGTGPITGTIISTDDGPVVKFEFTGVTGYDSSTDELKTKQWRIVPDSSSWQVNSEYKSEGATDTQVEKRSSIIYLVLDSSASLNATQIDQIKSAAQQFITSLYNQLYGGN
jgi:uncharacterized repeat protein (TIGR02543 family)